jgi:hypothetical protein
VKRRVAQCEGVAFAGADDAVEQRGAVGLTAEFDAAGERRIGGDKARGVCQRHRVDVGADETPAILGVPEDRIDEVGADAEVERDDRRTARRRAMGTVASEQLGGVVQVEPNPRVRF